MTIEKPIRPEFSFKTIEVDGELFVNIQSISDALAAASNFAALQPDYYTGKAFVAIVELQGDINAAFDRAKADYLSDQSESDDSPASF